MTRRQMRDVLAVKVADRLSAIDRDALCRMVGLDAGSVSLREEARLREAVDELRGVLLGSVAGQYKVHSGGR